jgi:hypothetical protein
MFHRYTNDTEYPWILLDVMNKVMTRGQSSQGSSRKVSVLVIQPHDSLEHRPGIRASNESSHAASDIVWLPLFKKNACQKPYGSASRRFYESEKNASIVAYQSGSLKRLGSYTQNVRPDQKSTLSPRQSATPITHEAINTPVQRMTRLNQASEPDSITAEFTPRVRLDHPNLSRPKLQPLIAGQGIHPVFKMERCVAATCTDTGTAGWKNLDRQ